MNDTINRYLAILCYPFVSVQFFHEDFLEKMLQEKEPNRRRKLGEKLKDDIVQYMKQYYNIYSYDEVYLYMEKCYLYDLQVTDSENILKVYFDKFNEIIQSMISQRDGKIVFKYWRNAFDSSLLGGFGEENKIFIYHSMNMHITLDFLVMLYIVQNNQNTVYSLDNYYGQIDVADQQLDGILRQGVAENHLHKGVSLSFLEIWEKFMQPVDTEFVKMLEYNDFGLNYSGIEENEMLFYIFSAGIVRLFLALEISGEDIETIENEGKKIYTSFADGKSIQDMYLQTINVKEDKKKQRMLLITYFLRTWEDVLSEVKDISKKASILRHIFQVDGTLRTLDENIFLFYAMKYYVSNCSDSNDTISEKKKNILKKILQYLRIKNVVFNCLIQKKTIRGLDYFQKEFYNKNSKLNKLVGYEMNRADGADRETIYWEQAMRKQFQNQYLKKIEFRTCIDDKELKFRKSVRSFLCAYRNIIRDDYSKMENGKYVVQMSFPRVGLVMHLLRTRDSSVPNKCLIDGMEGDVSRIQFGELEEKYDKQIKIMKKLRDEIPGLDQYLVGIDVASLENSTPVWVFKDVYEQARDSTIEKMGYTKSSGTQSLRFTFHAGEEFRHLLSGLRRIDEAVTFLKFHAGDRIGHGTALGVDPEIWKRKNPFVVIPQEEALQNYIWAYYMLSKEDIDFQSTVMVYIERRVEQLTHKIYGGSQGITMPILVQAYKEMFSSFTKEHLSSCIMSKEIGFCDLVRKENCKNIMWNSERIVMANHCKKFLVEMERPIHYEVTEQDIIITNTLQGMLKRKLSKKGIIIEINPTSNVAIGEVDKITDNQIYQLNGIDSGDNVMVCINSDDPTVFNTNVSNELSYIYYGMLKKVKSREAALQWLDKIRKCGMDASFIQNAESDQVLYDNLEKIIAKL